jgi:hypothetical protein
MPRPSMSGEGRSPQITLRLAAGAREDGQWAADVLDTTVSRRLREAHEQMVREAERASGLLRPSARPGPQPE